MSPLLKIANKLFAAFDSFIEGLPLKTKMMIQQLFFLTIAILSTIGLIVGIGMGKSAADKGGLPMVSETKDVFDIDITRKRESVSFDEMVDTKEIFEKNKKSLQKSEPQKKADTIFKSDDTIIEKDEAKALPGADPIKSKTEILPLEPDELIIDKETKDLPLSEKKKPLEPLEKESYKPDEIMEAETEELVPPVKEKSEVDAKKKSETQEEQTKSDDSTTWLPSGEDPENKSNLVPMKKKDDILE